MQYMTRVGHDCSKQLFFSRLDHLRKRGGILREIPPPPQPPHQALQPLSIADGREAPPSWRGVQEGGKCGRSDRLLQLEVLKISCMSDYLDISKMGHILPHNPLRIHSCLIIIKFFSNLGILVSQLFQPML